MRLYLLISLAASLALSTADAKLKVASLNTVLSDVAQNVGGDQVDVEWIIRPGIDPHAFQPSPSDIQKISTAAIVLASGKGLEGYLTKLEQSSGKTTRFIIVGDSIPSLKMAEGSASDHADHAHGEQDPHWWHSIKNVKLATNVIRDAFIAADPENAASYRANASAYQSRLDDLSKWVRHELALLPSDQRKLVTSHDAFQYFARENGFTIASIEGVSTSDQPTSRQVAELIEAVKKQGVKAIFLESAVNPKVVREITDETNARVGGELLADGLDGKRAPTYEDMIKTNVTTLMNGLK